MGLVTDCVSGAKKRKALNKTPQHKITCTGNGWANA